MDVVMPQLGETVNEGTIAAWHKKAGDTVEKGEMLLDVETDKVATEVLAPASGVVSSINVEEGDTVDVGTVLAVIAVEGEVVVAADATAAAAATEVTASPSSAGLPAKSAGNRLPAKSAGNRLSPAVRRLLSKHDLDVSAITGSGRDGRVTRQDVENHIESASGAASDAGVTRVPFDRVRKATAEHMVRSKATSRFQCCRQSQVVTERRMAS